VQLNAAVRGQAGALVAFGRACARRLDALTAEYEVLDCTAVPLRTAQRRGAGAMPEVVARGKSGRLGWFVGVRLLLARGPAVCRRLDALPPDPLRAVSAGVAFSVSGCPGCAPVSAAVGAAAATAGPLMSMLAIVAFVLGRAATLYLAAAAGGRWLRADDPRKARRVDVVLGVVLLLSAAYYAYRLVDGQVLTTLPGEGQLLP
jgi:cytochrome c biogenesis protein CcdA